MIQKSKNLLLIYLFSFLSNKKIYILIKNVPKSFLNINNVYIFLILLFNFKILSLLKKNITKLLLKILIKFYSSSKFTSYLNILTMTLLIKITSFVYMFLILSNNILYVNTNLMIITSTILLSLLPIIKKTLHFVKNALSFNNNGFKIYLH